MKMTSGGGGRHPQMDFKNGRLNREIAIGVKLYNRPKGCRFEQHLYNMSL